MIHVIAIITAKPGKRDEILGHFSANVPAVHAEKGCIEYGATVDTDGMGSFRPSSAPTPSSWSRSGRARTRSRPTALRRTWRPTARRPGAHRQPRHPRPVADLIAAIIGDADVADYDRDGVVCLRGQFDARWIERMRARDRARPRLARPQRDQLRRGQQRRQLLRRHVHVEVRPGLPRRRARVPAAGHRRAADGLGARRLLLRPAVREGARHGASHAVAPGPALLAGEGLADRLGLDRARSRSTAATAPSSSSPARTAGACNYRPTPFRKGHEIKFTSSDLQQIPDIDADRSKYDIRWWEMAPGDCLVFHAMIVHGAPGNDTPGARRRGLSLRYTGDDARYDPRPGTFQFPAHSRTSPPARR